MIRITAALFALMLTGLSYGASIDIGRGEIPLVVPDKYDQATPIPLVVLVHGYTSSGAGQEAYFKLSALSDEYGFIFVAPDGTVEKGGDKNRFWNAGEICCNFQGSDVNDAAYLKTLIDAIRNRYNIDENRIFMAGHSNGGFMVHRMAYEYPETIAAIVALNGSAPNRFTKPRPTEPVSILHIHGTEDRLNAYNGGDIRGVPYPGALTGARNWAYYAFGSGALTEDGNMDLDTKIPGSETSIAKFADGNIEVWTIDAGGHIPAFPDDFNRKVVSWMYAHPKKQDDLGLE